jgi:arsenate reductase
VVTVCDQAHEQCPYFPAKIKLIYVGFDDQPRLAAGGSDEQGVPGIYRRVRDKINVFVEKLPETPEE